MKKSFVKWLEDTWYGEMYISPWFAPLSLLYVDAVRLRSFAYRIGLKKSIRLPVPVIVVGNITVGGTGKTPLVIWIANYLCEAGYKPGIVSRGYRGLGESILQPVNADSDPKRVGDEAVLIARHTDCPMIVGAKRGEAGQRLLVETGCNVLIADDGLQHYALQRDVEIIVIDGQRRFGNGYCLPAGPLREPPSRLKEVDLVIVNDGEPEDGELTMRCVGDTAVNLATGERKPLAEFKDQTCHAIAGIGNPLRFFRLLERAGLQCRQQAFADHHAFTAEDLDFKDSLPVLMTEKDAVKCGAFKQSHHWYVPIEALPEPAFAQQLLSLLKNITHG